DGAIAFHVPYVRRSRTRGNYLGGNRMYAAADRRGARVEDEGGRPSHRLGLCCPPCPSPRCCGGPWKCCGGASRGGGAKRAGGGACRGGGAKRCGGGACRGGGAKRCCGGSLKRCGASRGGGWKRCGGSLRIDSRGGCGCGPRISPRGPAGGLCRRSE